jgi:hypothetical protein
MKALEGRNTPMNDAGRDRDETHPEGLTEFELTAFRIDDISEHRDDVGWSWDQSKVTRTHPDDPEIHYRIDPATQEVVLSAKLVEQLRRELGRARRGAGR